MDCGIPFCHSGCPLGNLIPEWNERLWRDDYAGARQALEETNNFPEVTGRICPAPCEASCVLNLQGSPVTIKDIERAIGDSLGDDAFLPRYAAKESGKRVAVVGSGPAGLAAAQQLARAGHAVTVLERDERAGGLLRFGIPDFKLDKALIDKRLEQMRLEGVRFETGVNVGVDVEADELARRFDALVLCLGARRPRDLDVPGRELAGVHYAMDFLAQQNRRVAGAPVNAPPIDAAGKRVIILGGGDTGADCLGTSLRQGAASVRQLELLPQPPLVRPAHNPWPEWPMALRTTSSHEEGGERDFGVLTKRLVGEGGVVRALVGRRVQLENGRLAEVGTEDFALPCDLVLLAMGFIGPERLLVEQLGLATNERGTIVAPGGATRRAGVFAAGDAVRGASLVVWAIAEGRRAAAAVDAYLAARSR
jgi:glutamate synthase (NADPH) small chain